MLEDEKIERGTLVGTEPHPAAYNALEYLRNVPVGEMARIQEAMASSAIEGNRMAEVCLSTIDRILTGQKLSDRYLLGLAWFIKELRDGQSKL